MSVVETSFKYDENAISPILLKTVTNTGILIDQVHTCERLLLFHKKHFCLRAYYEMFSWRNLSKNALIEAHRNIECINFRLQFPKFCLVRCFTLSFYYDSLCSGRYMKEAADWLKWISGKHSRQVSTFRFRALNLVQRAVWHFLLIMLDYVKSALPKK